VEIVRTARGEFIARDLGAEGKKGTRLDGDKFETLAAGWPAYRGDFTRPEAIRAGEAADMPRPIVHGWRLVDGSLLGQRFNGGRPSRVAGATRDLATEEYRVRLPRPYDATRAAGVVIWVDARPRADVPASLGEACDALGLIAAAPREAPNSRAVADRYQVALDALASVEANFLVDRRRVYVSGLSGGGQIATHLWACLPDTFTGAAPTVALASTRNVVVGTGQMWQGTIGKPAPAVLKQIAGHRCAAVTGSNDFNRNVVHEVAKTWLADGLEVRVFDFEGLGHEVATSAQFLEVLRWVDEPYRASRDAETARANDLLAGALTPAGTPAPGSHATLVEVTAAAPWSEPAWKAARALGAWPRAK
jgi:predicted esterase